MSFARFMDVALYHPELGYYEQRHPIGRRGDYTTSVGVGSLFGELLAFAFDQWAAELNGPLQLVEAGAHDGRLARDILGWFRDRRAAPHEPTYWIVEPSPARRAWQHETLGDLARHVRWADRWDELERDGGIQGIIFANELLDALPVRRWGWDLTAQAWFEWGVGAADDRFVWVPLEPADPEAGGNEAADDHPRSFFPLDPRLSQMLPDGFTVETCAAAVRCWRQAAACLRQGRLLTFDYGLPAEDLLSPSRSRGTVRAYRQHHVSDAVLDRPGEQDLTAHVNFSALQAAGEEVGLKTEALGFQGDFLVRILGAIERMPGAFPPWTAARRRQLGTLVHPDHYGRAFRVLVQSREERS